MKRHEFIAGLAGAAAWSVAARAQQAAMPVIGFLSTRSSGEKSYLTDAFRRELAEGGYVEGQHATVEYRWVEEDYDRLPAMAMELSSPPGGRAGRIRRRRLGAGGQVCH